MAVLVKIPNLGEITDASGMIPLTQTSDGAFRVGVGGVCSITATGDKKVEFVAWEDRTLAYVRSAMGYPAYYPLHEVKIDAPVEAVLMDLDGTSVRSESFWVWIIEQSAASVLGDPKFTLEEADLPHVSGHSVSEHLQYCLRKYCPDRTVEEARKFYFEHTRREMRAILEGRGRKDAFTPTPHLKEFLLELKSRKIKIALVTSGLYEKAWPEIVSAFKTLELGDPKDFYDAVITAGIAMHPGQPGTLGELSPKPHPWLYAEAARMGLGMDFSRRHRVIGIEDSGAGVCSIRLAGFAPIGYDGGNIPDSGTRECCLDYVEDFSQVLKIIDDAKG